MSTELTTLPNKTPVLAGDRGLQFSDMDSMYRFCKAVVNSGTFKDINTPEVALIRLQAGLELGLTPIWSLTNIFVVNGKPTVYGDGLLGIVLAQPTCKDVVETFEGEGDQLVAVCEVLREGRLPVKRTFSVADAKRAGLWQKAGPWTQYGGRMLQMRARSWACRDAFADALRGLGVVEELREVEPRPANARVAERPKLVLPDEEFANTEPKPVSTSLAVANQAEASEGPEKDGNKPLMRNRTGDDPSSISSTASDTLSEKIDAEGNYVW